MVLPGLRAFIEYLAFFCYINFNIGNLPGGRLVGNCLLDIPLFRYIFFLKKKKLGFYCFAFLLDKKSKKIPKNSGKAVRKFLQNYGSVFFSKLLFIFLYLVYNKKRNFI